MNIEEALRRLCLSSVESGASEAKPIKAESVVVRDWVRLKCQYGCNGYGKRLTCPPYTPTPEEFRKVLKSYEWAILMRFDPRELEKKGKISHEIVVKLEREAFLAGYYSAFGLACGPCPYCKECDLGKCVHPELARPSMEACGIDVFATVRRAGFNLEVLMSHCEKPSSFGLLLIR